MAPMQQGAVQDGEHTQVSHESQVAHGHGAGVARHRPGRRLRTAWSL